jgi:hypothetical protein
MGRGEPPCQPARVLLGLPKERVQALDGLKLAREGQKKRHSIFQISVFQLGVGTMKTGAGFLSTARRPQTGHNALLRSATAWRRSAVAGLRGLKKLGEASP